MLANLNYDKHLHNRSNIKTEKNYYPYNQVVLPAKRVSCIKIMQTQVEYNYLKASRKGENGKLIINGVENKRLR